MIKVLLVLIASQSWAALPPTTELATPQLVVQKIIEQAKLLNGSHKSQSIATIESLVDFETLADEALADHRSELAANDAIQIKDLLKKIITRSVYPKAPQFFNKVKVEFTNQEKDNDRVKVHSEVTKENRKVAVEYWVKSEGSKLRVVDLAIEGESWVASVRNQFDNILKKDGASGLIAKMQKKLSQIK